MNFSLESNVLNNIKKDTVIFKKNEHVNYMGFLIKGTVNIENSGISRVAKAGDMIGIVDLYASEYTCTYTAAEDLILYAFPVFDVGSIENFLNTNKDYRGIMIDSLTRELMQYLSDREYLLNRAKEMFLFLRRHYESAVKEGMNESVPTSFLETLPEDILEIDCDEQKMIFYKECANVPLSIKKQYYANSEIMALYQAEEISYIIIQIQKTCMETVQYIKNTFIYYTDENGDGLFDKEVRFAMEMKRTGRFMMEQYLRLDDTKQKILDIANGVQKRTGDVLPYDREYLENKLNMVMNAPMEDMPEDYEVDELNIGIDVINNSIDFLTDSLQQILEFAETEKEYQKKYRKYIDDFIELKDRFATDDATRLLKKNITKEFFELYKKCIFKWFEDKNVPLPVKLFLDYGYMDERLLDREQLFFLCDMANEKMEDLPCKIYRMTEWLEEIYEGNKDTSRNAFERDYRDELREEKRLGRINDKEEKELLQDKERRVIFEVDNMFTNNNKIVNGKLSTYVPVLYKDEFFGSIEKLYLTRKQLSDTVLELEAKDFTVFFREVLYMNPEMKIEKEYVMKHVYPDVIISPVYGMSSSMWQEITGKKRDTPARFIFPAFCEGDLYKQMTKAFGRFHWEYCRCAQGTAWNNIQYKSLTSEYMDYIQYYRKNRDLSEERRDKIRTQIQRARNNTREIFLSDYEMWIYSESNSAMKLNKVSRDILATYCPFSKNIRESLKTNGVFAESMMRQQRNFQEKSHEWELRIRRRENNDLEIPEEFQLTYDFYTNK